MSTVEAAHVSFMIDRNFLNERMVKEWRSIGKIKATLKPKNESSAPTFAFNKAAFKQKFSGSHLEYVSAEI